MTDLRASDRHLLIRLVGHVARHGPLKAREEDGAILICGQGSKEVPVRSTILRQACALGLLDLAAGRVKATSAAPAFLRRAVLEPDHAFADQHRQVEKAAFVVDGVSQTVRVNRLESPLGAIARLKEKSGQPVLPPEALAAGERLHADFTRAHLQPRLTMDYRPRTSSKSGGMRNGAVDLSDTALAARDRIGKAMDAIGPELCGVALDVCCFEKGLEQVERERQWPARSAKLMLRTALLALARHYAPPARSARHSHAWGDEGYRPDIMLPAGARPRP